MRPIESKWREVKKNSVMREIDRKKNRIVERVLEIPLGVINK